MVGEQFRQLINQWLLALVFGLFVLAVWVFIQDPARLLPFAAVALPLAAGLAYWSRRSPGTLPILPPYLLMQALVYASPLLAQDLTVDNAMKDLGRDITPAHLQFCALDLLIWFSALPLGWALIPPHAARLKPAATISDALDRAGQTPTVLLVLALSLALVINSPFYWQILGALGVGLLSPIRTLIAVFTLVGSFAGAYAWSRSRLRAAPIWALSMGGMLLINLSSLLLSSIQLQVLAALGGLWLARHRQFLLFVIAMLLALNLLHNGKFEMRNRYWGAAPPPPQQLFVEWIQAGLRPSEDNASLYGSRFNSFSNLAYVEDALMRGYPTMNGATFAVIPQVLVPRAFGEGKVRSQEGQALLNLHFGRQRSREDTEKAYIAWGLLTEAIANFGRLLGPLLVGLATGALIRVSENIGRGQLLLTTPGLTSLALMFAWVTAYESAASTFTAAVFQTLVVITFLGWWFTRRRRSRRTAR